MGSNWYLVSAFLWVVVFIGILTGAMVPSVSGTLISSAILSMFCIEKYLGD